MGGEPGLILRTPTVEDGARVWQLVARMGGLELNSCYAYLLLCSHFADTCLIAEEDGALRGFVMAYRPPVSAEQIFVWQVGVAPEARGTGLAGRLLDHLVGLPAAAACRFLTATVSPDNEASLSLFKGFARRRGAPCAVEAGLPAALFPEHHPDEDLIRIGPLPARAVERIDAAAIHP